MKREEDRMGILFSKLFEYNWDNLAKNADGLYNSWLFMFTLRCIYNFINYTHKKSEFNSSIYFIFSSSKNCIYFEAPKNFFYLIFLTAQCLSSLIFNLKYFNIERWEYKNNNNNNLIFLIRTTSTLFIV